MSIYPTDWSPLLGGDPCPGDVESWTSIVSHWASRAEEIDALRRTEFLDMDLQSRGRRIEQVKQAMSSGELVCSVFASEFERLSGVAKNWQDALRDMQARAVEALGRARAAHARLQELDAQDNVKPSDFENREFLESLLESQQAVLDGIREEYARVSAEAAANYYLADVDGLFADVNGRADLEFNPFSDAGEVFDSYFAGAESQVFGFDLKAKTPEEYEALLEGLAGLNPDEIAEYFSQYDATDLLLPPATGDTVWETAKVKNWWASLTPAQQMALENHGLGFIGNLNGVPYASRHRANEHLLNEFLAMPEVTGEARVGLEKIRWALDNADAAGDLQIAALDLTHIFLDDDNPANDVLVALAVGNLDSADAVTELVPGMDTYTSRSLHGLVDNASFMKRLQDRHLEMHQNDAETATLIYLGYETPDFFSVLENSLADEGGKRLAHFNDGLNVTKSQNWEIPQHGAGRTDAYNDPFISVNAHSYGTTTSAKSFMYSQTKVNNAVFNASPGVHDPDLWAEILDGKWQLEGKADEKKLYTLGASGDNLEEYGQWMTYFISDESEYRFDPDLIPYSKSLPNIDVFDSEGNIWNSVWHHSVDSSIREHALDRQGYWGENSVALWFGSQASLDGLIPFDPEFSVARYYLRDANGDPIYEKYSYKKQATIPMTKELWEIMPEEERQYQIRRMEEERSVSP